ncbi:23S rRNA (adenine(1618)-N(6))-methyltransferase RlmF [Lewinella sp. LCG006]|uniref:23S rRNA (adenine(1618)-N(6))-methyltransferase RlmF n=1 Tax=Lewinella sp. LCG006 TaxID=3231911 RepID=UPI00345F1939
MSDKKRPPTASKQQLHPRNKHLRPYDFDQLKETNPALSSFVKPNKFGNDSINFFDPLAVKALNKALLKQYYGIDYWDIPDGYLCPPIPGRADYIHYLADLLYPEKSSPATKAYFNEKIKCLDIGVGANCVYPIIGSSEYGWSFIGSDVDQVAIEHAQSIVENNKRLQSKVTLRLQPNTDRLLQGILLENERVELVLCNPPFHASAQEAQAANQRKQANLKGKPKAKPHLNFGGQSNELWYPGGEKQFLSNLIQESKAFATSCFWFTSLVSKEAHLKFLYQTLEKIGPTAVKTIPMAQGNKTSRILAWTFLTAKQRKAWEAYLSL